MDQQQQPPQNEPLRLLVFAASLRNDSLNHRLALLAKLVIEKNGGIVDFAQTSDFDCPSYSQDLELKAMPEGAIELRKRLEASNAFIIASPEYNGSMPGFLKNIIDWVSRFRPQPFKEKHALLMSASPSMAGGNRGLWSLRMPLEHLGANVHPNMFSLAMAHQAFDGEGHISDATLGKRFEDNIIAFMELVEAATHYPCMKQAWVEFLGERPDPVTERVE
jgi:chromate reductase, NAD(P)H dehydrogenase (quinone)